MDPKVSVIIPTYNRASVLSRAIGSVAGQSFTNWELIVIDDGSVDETPALLQEFLKDSRIAHYRQVNQGVSAARNKGLSLAKGEWVAFLDSDDEWLEDKLLKQIEYTSNFKNHPLIHGDEIWIRNGVRVNPMNKHKKEGGDAFLQSLKLCCISPSTVLIKKALFYEVGFFREDFPVCEDYDLWLKITSRYSIGYIDDFLIKKYGGHEDQLSRKYRAMDYWRILSIASCINEETLSDEKRALAIFELKKKRKILLKGYRKHENLACYDQIFNIVAADNFKGPVKKLK